LKEIVNTITSFIKEQAPGGVVIGLSGGLDSSVAAALAVKALGKKLVLGIMMPDYNNTPKADIEDAHALIEKLQIDYRIFDMARVVTREALNIISADRLVLGNFMARMRMAVLYAYAGSMNRRVVGTSDKSEIALGFFTKFGDGAADLEPIGDLYKTEVRMLARYLELPKRIYEKPSSPALWQGQTAEGEIGHSYDEVDVMLKGMTPMSETIKKRIAATEHKRHMPPVCALREAIVNPIHLFWYSPINGAGAKPSDLGLGGSRCKNYFSS
jgi:NAD+ synthase